MKGPCPVKGSVDDFYFPGLFFDKLRPEEAAPDHVLVRLINLFVNDNQKPLRDCLLAAHLFYFRNRVYLVNYSLVVRRDDLRAPCPVSLVAVVFGRVVACGNYYAGIAAQAPNRERKFRRRPHG